MYISRTMCLAKRVERESAKMSRSETWNDKIHKVYPSLRTVNEKEYEPSLVSIGPYHHGSQNLQEMENHKFFMLDLLLERTKISLEKYTKFMRGIKGKALGYYASDITMEGEEFVEMMILDGCFILEFLRKMQQEPCMSVLNKNQIFRDLVLFENQLPLFVLRGLFKFIKAEMEISEMETFEQLITEFVKHFCVHYIGEKKPPLDIGEIEKSPHLLCLVYITCMKCMKSTAITVHSKSDNKRNFIKSATTLEEFGVVFKKAEKDAKLQDIRFTKNDGVLKIPLLMISDQTEAIFRNLVAYERYIGQSDFTDYLFFMNCLIKSPEDVELLCRRGIIENMLGNHENVSRMFNEICFNAVDVFTGSDFDDLCYDINDYSARRLNNWMAKLWHQYFSDPWSTISVFATIGLVGFTAVQTVFSIIS